MPVVSVVISTHNRAGLVGAAIESVLNQTFRDFEVIVVDDASEDDTEKTVRSFRDARIRYIRHPVGKGDAATRNTGIRNATGEYIAFLDDDDEWLPEKLRLQVHFCEAGGPELGGVHTARWTIHTATGKRSLTSLPGCSPDDLSRNRITTSSMLLRRRCVESVGLFDERFPCCSDFDLWIRISRQFSLGYIKEPLVNYYVHGNSLSSNPAVKVRGLEMLAAKHREFFATSVAANSRRQRTIGIKYCYVGDMKKARAAFSRATWIDPWEVRNYFYLLLSLLGPARFRKVMAFRSRLVAGL
jgi:glycosyltransferase involved in cell wall biosynthesis